MKKRFLIASVISIALASCTKENTTTSTTTSPETETNVIAEENNVDDVPETDNNPANGTYCYLNALNNDSMKVKIVMEGDKISGDLDRIPYQKDRAKGTFTGTKRADGKFDVDYKYMQEGVDQNAKLVFDIDSDELEINNDPVYNAELKSVACK